MGTTILLILLLGGCLVTHLFMMKGHRHSGKESKETEGKDGHKHGGSCH